jgi:hypothetical protein
MEEGRKLLALARGEGIPVFHIRHDAGPGSPYDVSARIGAIADAVAPRAGYDQKLSKFVCANRSG